MKITVVLGIGKGLLVMLVLLPTLSCSSGKSISGSYRSNFAAEGFFVTNLVLKPDSAFGYQLRGDVLNDAAKGRFSVINKEVIMRYDKPVLEAGGYAKSGPNDSLLFQPEAIGDRGPKCYRIGHFKLFIVDSLGRKKTKACGYSNRKKFLFWGDYYLLTRRYYLKKID